MKLCLAFVLFFVCFVVLHASAHEITAELRERVCSVLAIHLSDCVTQVEFLGEPPLLAARQAFVFGGQRHTRNGEQITMHCQADACLPFLILLHGPAARTPRAQRVTRSVRPAHFAVHAGESAQLLQQGRGVRLTRSVRCLDNGRLGDVIRVRDKDAMQTMLAVVVAVGELGAAY